MTEKNSPFTLQLLYETFLIPYPESSATKSGIKIKTISASLYCCGLHQRCADDKQTISAYNA